MRPWINHLLAQQDGLITLGQATGNGTSARTVQRRVVSGDWERLAPRVFLVGGHPFTDTVRVRAAGLWAGDRAAVCGVAAAWWHGMHPNPPPVVEVTVPRGRALRPPDGIRLRRRDLAAVDLVNTRHLWVTDRPLSALEAAAALPDGSVFLDRALQKHVSFRRVYAAYCRNLGARGFGRAGDLLVAAADRADSAAERLLRRILCSAGISGWVPHHQFGPYLIDVAFPQHRVAIEVDGWAWHVDVERFQADRRKGNALGQAGWDLLRFTWHELADQPQTVVGEIRAALDRARRRRSA